MIHQGQITPEEPSSHNGSNVTAFNFGQARQASPAEAKAEYESRGSFSFERGNGYVNTSRKSTPNMSYIKLANTVKKELVVVEPSTSTGKKRIPLQTRVATATKEAKSQAASLALIKPGPSNYARPSPLVSLPSTPATTWKSRLPTECEYCLKMFSNKFNLKQVQVYKKILFHQIQLFYI